MLRTIVRLLPIWYIRLTSIMVRWTSRLLGNRQYEVLEKWLPKRKNRSVLLVAGQWDNEVHPDVGRE